MRDNAQSSLLALLCKVSMFYGGRLVWSMFSLKFRNSNFLFLFCFFGGGGGGWRGGRSTSVRLFTCCSLCNQQRQLELADFQKNYVGHLGKIIPSCFVHEFSANLGLI